MISKITAGKDFYGALRYVLTKEGELITKTVAGFEIADMAREMKYITQMNERVQKPVYHVSLSLPEDEGPLSAEEWEQIAEEYMEGMGMGIDRPYVVYRHQDTDRDHIHIIMSRVGYDGKCWDRKYERWKTKDVTQAIAKRHGLKVIPTKKTKNRPKVERNEKAMYERLGEENPKELISQAIEDLTKNGPISVQDFCERLQEKDIYAVPNIASTGRINGFSFVYESKKYKASQVGWKWKELREKVLITDESDIEYLQGLKAVHAQHQPGDPLRAIQTSLRHVLYGGKKPFIEKLAECGWILEKDEITSADGAKKYKLEDLGIDTQELYGTVDMLARRNMELRERASEIARKYYKRKNKNTYQWLLRQAKTPEEEMMLGIMAICFVPAYVALSLVLRALVQAPPKKDELEVQMQEYWSRARAKAKEMEQEIWLLRKEPKPKKTSKKTSRVKGSFLDRPTKSLLDKKSSKQSIWQGEIPVSVSKPKPKPKPKKKPEPEEWDEPTFFDMGR